MSPNTIKIYEEILALTEEERAELTARLQEDEGDSVNDWASDEVAAAWDEEIHRRVEACDRGEIELIPWEEVERRMNEKYGFLLDKP